MWYFRHSRMSKWILHSNIGGCEYLTKFYVVIYTLFIKYYVYLVYGYVTAIFVYIRIHNLNLAPYV